MIPPAGVQQVALLGNRSQQDQNLAFAERLSVTGSLTVSIGTFARRGESVKKSVIASFAQAPVAGAAYIFVTNGDNPDEIKITVLTNAFAASSTPILVNIVGVIGSNRI